MRLLTHLSRVLTILVFFAVLMTIEQSQTSNVMAQAPLPLCAVSGTISVDTTWTSDCLYVVDNNIIVAPNGILTVSAGTIIKVKSGKSFTIQGTFKVLGTVSNPVYITSYLDDEVGGDTNQDGRNSTPAAGNWKRITFTDSSLDSANVIEHATIRYGETIVMEAASPTLRNNNISYSSNYALSMDVNSEPATSNNTLFQNYRNGMEIRKGKVTTTLRITRTWASTDIVYIVSGYLTYGVDVTLFIKPGVKVKILPNQLIGIEGSLQVQGTSENPVHFTSLKDDEIGGDTNNDGRNSGPSPGDWGQIYFAGSSDDTTSIIEHAVIQYGGYHYACHWGACSQTSWYYEAPCYYCKYSYFGAIRMGASAPRLINNLITNSYRYALSMDIFSQPQTSGNILLHNYYNGMEVRAGKVTTTQPIEYVWSNIDIVYIVSGYLTYGPNVTLRIDQAAKIKFIPNTLIGIEGTLKVRGAADEPVYFTSLKDDTIGGDTNNDGQNSAPAPGDWGQIYFADSSNDNDSFIEHAVIRYGGYHYACHWGACSQESWYYEPPCYYCRMEYRRSIRLHSASPSIKNTLIEWNNRGIETKGESSPKLLCNDIFNNQMAGIQNTNPSLGFVAQNHWWGDPSGPTHASNPGGTGQAVSDGVDFRPWATERCFVLPVPTPTPTITPTSPPTDTPLPTNTPLPTETPTNTPTFTPTATPTPSPTPTNTPRATPAVTPTIAEIRPNQGSTSAPNTINIRGRNFQNGAVAQLGNNILTTAFVDATYLRADVPAGLAAGVYNLTVTNPDGGQATLVNSYTVFDAATNDDLFGYEYELVTDPLVPHANAPTLLRLKVHRQGGKGALPDVKVRFYLGPPQSGGTAIGDGTIVIFSPNSQENSSGVSWVPTTAGEAAIYAVIDPDNAIAETYEGNNTVQRTITVLSPAPDTVAPHVDSFTINDSAATTTDRTVTLRATASDEEPGTGVAKLLFVEFEYSQGAADWVPVRASAWIDYATAQNGHSWPLVPASGMRYLQAWAADGAGNISPFPAKAFINFLPPLQTVAQNQRQSYRFPLATGDRLSVRLEAVSGDPDLYIWAPEATSAPWISNLRDAVDDLLITAPTGGNYQVEVHGFTAAEYRLIVVLNPDQVNAAAASGGVDPTKPAPSLPPLATTSEPSSQFGINTPGVAERQIYLPVVQR